MRRFSLLLLLISLLPSTAAAQAKAVPQSQPLVFTHVTVIDATGERRAKELERNNQRLTLARGLRTNDAVFASDVKWPLGES